MDTATAHPAQAASPVGLGSTVAVLGLGYVGLPTVLAFLTAGLDVIGLDVSAGRLADIRSGQVDLLPVDRARLERYIDDPRLLLTDEAALIEAADAVLICVPTPVDGHRVPDLTALAAACSTVVERAVPGQTLVLTSTTYVGSTRDLLIRPLAARGFAVGRDIHVAYSSERIDPGNATDVPETTPRVVGGATPACGDSAGRLLGRVAASIHQVSSPEVGEMSKLFENTFRAVNIALANEVADACRHLGLSAFEVVQAAGTKPYGFMPFYPSPGVGGHCIPCDPHYLLWHLRGRRIPSPLIDTAMASIAARPRQVVARARAILGDAGVAVRGARILVVGVAYKADVADVRESPALEIISALAAFEADVAYIDPLVPVIEVDGTPYKSEEAAVDRPWDLVIVHTAHRNASLDWLSTQPRVLDTTYRLPASPGTVVL